MSAIIGNGIAIAIIAGLVLLSVRNIKKDGGCSCGCSECTKSCSKNRK